MGYNNIIITNTNRIQPKKVSPIGTIFIFIFYLVLAFLVSYITVMTFKYLRTDCLSKKSWFEYVFKFCYKDVCNPPQVAIVDKINIKNTIPPEALPSINLPNKPVASNITPTQTIKKPEEKNVPMANTFNRVISGIKDPAIEYDIDKLKERPQVFHIANQDYTYYQAKCKCASYNAKLANYSQMVDAYNKGADWCSYGWSEGQAAYYPTQKCNWLKKSDEDKKKCGKPGINGGFFGDPNLKFGVNCYGRKPKGSIIKMQEQTCDYCEIQQNEGANKRLDTDQILPFNDGRWSL